jgi:MoxR-like ATPase
MTKNELNSLEVKHLLRYFIKNNVRLAEEGKMPIAIEIEGMPGTAKTSVVKQVGEEFDFHYVRLNLSEIEVCDLVGLPLYEYKVVKEKDPKEKDKEKEVEWVSDKVLQHYTATGWKATGESRTSYSKPIWIQGKEGSPVLLVLDDYNRVTPMMTNACMTLIDEQRYTSWGLPKGSTIVLTCNPSDQDFMVQQEDSAQAT